ncbi:hypothetical protein I6F50_01570 [Pseudoalteromonas sp. NZS127_1]|uniref:hypothetical protein n=1 Tax=Pseudoalteromonas sp. NZS127_1 TaxID=2792074 RepID=UPI0018CEFCAF|nr:hypothetical protein [Pseudoalteromonas sp. NZS127_1]MBG9993740.1 hypothetical protein [Pseudoalteromonas sp. NZS127_1]
MLSKKKLLPSIFILSSLYSVSSNAGVFDLPDNCTYGRAESFELTSDDIGNGVEAGYDIYNDNDRNYDQAELNSWKQLVESLKEIIDSYDYVRIESPKFVLQNQSFRVKANLFDTFANIRFNNSEFGYVGTDKSSIEANAYRNMSFSKSYGAGLVWVNRANGMCSAESVWVQKPPQIISGDTSYNASNGQIVVNTNYKVDKYSEAAKNQNKLVRVQVNITSDNFNTTTSKSINVSELSSIKQISILPHAGAGLYSVQATVYDGNYVASLNLGSTFVRDGTVIPPCPRCNKN